MLHIKLSYTFINKSIAGIIIIIILLSTIIYPQKNDFNFSHLDSEDGLSLNIVTEVLQDSRGFLWFGTYNGLNRYDGYNFKIFLPEPSNPNSISNHSIWALYEDSHGFIWIGTLDGLNRYNWKTEEFKVYRNVPNDNNSLSNNNIYAIYEDKSGNLWIGTGDGLNKYDRKNDNFIIYKNVSNRFNTNSLNSVTSITGDHKGDLWLGTWNGLSRISKDGKVTSVSLPEPKHSDFTYYNEITSLLEDHKRILWIGTRGKGLYSYDLKTNKITNYYSAKNDNTTLSDNWVQSLFEDSRKNLWIGTKNGLNKFDRKKNKFTNIFNSPEKPLSISNNEIFCITEDKTGILWFGTSAGINKYFQPVNKFSFILSGGSEKNSLSNSYVNIISTDRYNNLWAGTREGLNKINLSTGQITSFLGSPEKTNSLSDNYVWSVIEDNEGYIWIGTDGGGLNRFNPLLNEFKTFKYKEDDTTSISNNGVISLCEDNKGRIWAGTWWGLNCFDKKTEKFTRYMNVLKNNTIWVIFEDSKGILWIGTDGAGVYMYNPETGRFKNFSKDSSSSNSFGGNRIIEIFESNDGLMWFGTLEGMESYDRTTNRFQRYSTIDGLPSNLVNNIQEDRKGNLWLGTDISITKFDRKNNTYENYTKRSGLIGVEFSPKASAVLSDGSFVFGNKLGLTIFHPDSIINESITASVVFTDLKIFNQSVPISKDGSTILSESIVCAKEVSIPYGNDVITIDFALLDYYNTKNNKFSYKLIGFEGDWNDVDSRNSATYTNLSPGEYTFIVKAANNNLSDNQKIASLKMVILPVFYQTLWFKLFLTLAGIILTLVIINARTRHVQKRNLELEEKILEHTKHLDKTIAELSQEIVERKKAEAKVKVSLEEKEVLLKEIHHRVKNNLQVISSLLYLQSTKVKDQETLNLFEDSQNRIKSMALIHEKLYQSKDFAEVDFYEYAHGLLQHLNRSYRKIGIPVNTMLHIKNISLSLDTAISCGLMINELVTNAYKYAFPPEWVKQQSGGDELLIEIQMEKIENKNYILTVSNNGISIPEDIDINKVDSLGLKLVSSMVRQLDGTIEICRENGTKFKIMFTDTL